MPRGLPALPRLPTLAGTRRPSGGRGPLPVRPKREQGVTEISLKPYPDPPPGFRGPLTEWVCYWWLGTFKRFRKDKDWYYQVALPALGVFASRDFTRVDFVLPVGADHPASATGEYRAVCWDPITPFTHPDPSMDRLKRAALAVNGYQLIWIDGATLEASPFDVLEKALRGVDISSRGAGR